MINIGAYAAGSNKRIDASIAKIDAITMFLRQKVGESATVPECVTIMKSILA